MRDDTLKNEDVRIQQAVTVSNDPATVPGWVISEQEFHLLVEGSGEGQNASLRNVSIGIALTAAVGVVGILATISDIDKGIKKLPLVFTILLGALTIASVALAFWFDRASKKETARASYQLCVNRIRLGLGMRSEPHVDVKPAAQTIKERK